MPSNRGAATKPSNEERPINLRLRTYTAYSIGTAIVWALIVVLAWRLDSSSTLHVMWLVSLGFFLGWLSATIARLVYPPPKKYRSPN